MKYYELLVGNKTQPWVKGEVYREDYAPNAMSVSEMIQNHDSNSWKEISEVEYFTRKGLPEFWQIERNIDNYKVINEWMNKHHCAEGFEYEYLDGNGYVNNQTTLKGKASDLDIISFEVFEKLVLGKKEEVLGYLIPYDLWNGQIKKESLYIKANDLNYRPANEDDEAYYLPNEIVESWEKCYDDLKEGDWMIVIQNCSYKGQLFKLDKNFRETSTSKYQVHGLKLDWTYPKQVRKATQEEIESQKIEIKGYEVEINDDNTVSFGCQTVSNDFVIRVSELQNEYNVDFTAEKDKILKLAKYLK